MLIIIADSPKKRFKLSRHPANAGSNTRIWRTRARNILEWIWTTRHGPWSSISTT